MSQERTPASQRPRTIRIGNTEATALRAAVAVLGSVSPNSSMIAAVRQSLDALALGDITTAADTFERLAARVRVVPTAPLGGEEGNDQ